MAANRTRRRLDRIVDPARPPMDPPHGVRQIKLAPHEMIDAVTASADIFVLAHLGIPRVDSKLWTLDVDGLVDRPLRLDLDDLKSRPRCEVEAVHQCCGNPLEPKTPTRRVANVVWAGADLTALLADAGVDPRARFLWSSGLDGGEFAGESCDWFVKDLPLERLAAGGVLLAFELNGEPLSAEHGFPVRLVVPGFYGTNSVKWLWRLHLADHRAESLFTTRFYSDISGPEEIAAGRPPQRPVWAIAPEAIIVGPVPHATIPVGQPVEIWGWAWSFRGVDTVEVSVDENASFGRAELSPHEGWAWRRFSRIWHPTVRGDATLSARATDGAGVTQPRDGARNAIQTVRVTVG